MGNMKALDQFLEDIDCLKPVTDTINKINIFEILGVKDTEIRHSYMLEWLMDPKGNHGLGDKVLQGMIRLVEDNPPQVYDDFQIRREAYNHIDLIAVSKTENYVFCIENKTYSGEHDNQLEKYRNIVETTFPGYRRKLVFLTPKGKASSDPENWLSLGYSEIVEVVEKAWKGSELQPEADLIIRNYIDVIRNLSGGDEDEKRICREIWQKHHAALELLRKYKNEAEENPDQTETDTEEKKVCREIYCRYQDELDRIFAFRPGKVPDPVADIIHRWAEIQAEAGAIELCREKTSEATIRFKTRFMSGLLPDVSGVKSGWGTHNFYFYELRNQRSREHKDEHLVYLQLCTNSDNIPDDLREMSDRINDASDLSSDEENWQHRINFSTDQALYGDNADEETVMTQLDRCLKKMLEYEQKLAEKLNITSIIDE